jgi:hypothetical protein
MNRKDAKTRRGKRESDYVSRLLSAIPDDATRIELKSRPDTIEMHTTSMTLLP